MGYWRRLRGAALVALAVGVLGTGVVVYPSGNGAAVGCAVATANVPDGPDPWGGCFPGPENTGVPAGTTLTAYTGSCTISVDGTVIDSKTLDCDVNIAATGVIIRNSQINGEIRADDPGTDGVSVIDSTIDAGPINNLIGLQDRRAMVGYNWSLLRVETMRGSSGGWCKNNCSATDSYIHGGDDDEGGDEHESAMRQEQNGTFTHNSFRCDAPFIDDGDGDAAGCSADITGYGDFTTIHDNTFENNLIMAAESGVYCAYGGSTGSVSGSKPFPFGYNNAWRNNIFQKGPPPPDGSGRCADATFGQAITDLNPGARGNVWGTNRWDDGTLMPEPD